MDISFLEVKIRGVDFYTHINFTNFLEVTIRGVDFYTDINLTNFPEVNSLLK